MSEGVLAGECCEKLGNAPASADCRAGTDSEAKVGASPFVSVQVKYSLPRFLLCRSIEFCSISCYGTP